MESIQLTHAFLSEMSARWCIRCTIHIVVFLFFRNGCLRWILSSHFLSPMISILRALGLIQLKLLMLNVHIGMCQDVNYIPIFP